MRAITSTVVALVLGAAAVAAPPADGPPRPVRMPAESWGVELLPREAPSGVPFDQTGFVRAVDGWLNSPGDLGAPGVAVASGVPRDHLIVVPLPTAASAGFAVLGALAGAVYLRRRRIEQAV